MKDKYWVTGVYGDWEMVEVEDESGTDEFIVVEKDVVMEHIRQKIRHRHSENGQQGKRQRGAYSVFKWGECEPNDGQGTPTEDGNSHNRNQSNSITAPPTRAGLDEMMQMEKNAWSDLGDAKKRAWENTEGKARLRRGANYQHTVPQSEYQH